MNKAIVSGSAQTMMAAAEVSLLSTASELTHWSQCATCSKSTQRGDKHRNARLA